MANVGRMLKEAMVEETLVRLRERPNFFVTRVNRLPAAEASALRQRLHGSSATLLMVQRRLGQRVVEPLRVAGLPELLEGSVALVFSGADVLAVAKLLSAFTKTHEEQLVIRGGMVDGQLIDRRRVEELATLPSKHELLAQVALTIESPLADVLWTLERVLGDVAWLIEQAARKQAPAEPAATVGGSEPHHQVQPADSGPPAAGPATDSSAQQT